jgi:hypothetical protein
LPRIESNPFSVLTVLGEVASLVELAPELLHGLHPQLSTPTPPQPNFIHCRAAKRFVSLSEQVSKVPPRLEGLGFLLSKERQLTKKLARKSLHPQSRLLDL